MEADANQIEQRGKDYTAKEKRRTRLVLSFTQKN